MNNYIPFLKFKINEIGALSTLKADVQQRTYPFLDLPKKDGMGEAAFVEMIKKARTAFDRHLKNFSFIFIDNYDIDDTLTVAGGENYAKVIQSFGSSTKFIPVIGLDRTAARNHLVFQAKATGHIAGSMVAVRLLPDDFQSFNVVKDEILELQKLGSNLFSRWIFVLDSRLCTNVESSTRSTQLNNFIANATGKLQMDAVIVAGSSIPASISELMKVSTEIHHPRNEISIFRGVASVTHATPIFLGDYTIVSPLYSDVDIPPEAMQNVIAAKVIYSHSDFHYIVRGGSLKIHPRARLQYNDIAGKIVAQTFYRGLEYSDGDLYLTQKSQFMGSGITAGSILKPTINSHITYMINGFPD